MAELNDTTPAMAQDLSDVKPGQTQEQIEAARIQLWLTRLNSSESVKNDRIPLMRDNISFRIGKPFGAKSQQHRVHVPKDWQLVKSKQAQLFSQMPEIRLAPRHKDFAEAVPVFAKKVNERISEARIGVAMDECLPDIINAAGYGALLVSWQNRLTPRQLDEVGAQSAALLKAEGKPVPQRDVPQITDSRLRFEHLPPDDVLIPDTFIGSDFDDSPWLGRAGRKPWSEAKGEFKLTEADYSRVVGKDTRGTNDRIETTPEHGTAPESDMVEFREVYYWRYLYHPDEPNYKAIQRMVFVKGIEDRAVIDEEWKGQQRTEQGTIIGAVKLPIRIGTLTYISNQAIPPSDSEMIRPQVMELNDSRSQMIINRKASVPVRWYNTNLVAQEVQTQLLRGTWQGMIPMNGAGDRAIGEVARAAYPREDFEFDRVANHDINETSQTEPTQGNEAGATAIRSASEAQIHQANFQTRVGYERARIVKFFVGAVEVAAGLIALYDTWTPEEEKALSKWPRKELSSFFVYTVRADATVLLDAAQRYERLKDFLNLTAKSGYIDIKGVITEMAECIGINPEYVRAPEQKGIDPANISLRITAEDLRTDPLVVAILLKANQMPTPEELEAAKKLMLAVQQPPAPPQPPPGGPGGPGMPPGAPGQPTLDIPLAPPMNQAGQPLPPGQPAPTPIAANPEWQEAERINKRTHDGQ